MTKKLDITIGNFLQVANRVATQKNTHETRESVNSLIERVLIKTDSYKGSIFLSEKEIPKGRISGLLSFRTKHVFNPDETRKKYQTSNSDKTITIQDLVEIVNEINKESGTLELRKTCNHILETVLKKTDNYRGYIYLSDKDIPEGEKPGIIETQTGYTFPDESRRYYIYSESNPNVTDILEL